MNSQAWHENNDGTCDFEDCQECCPHDEHDHGICMGCGADRLDYFIGKAEDAYEGDR